MMQFLSRKRLNNRTYFVDVTGGETDVSEYLGFYFYDIVWYFPGVHSSIVKDNHALDVWLGVYHQIRRNMCYWIMEKNGTPIAETTVQHVTRYNMLDTYISEKIIQFNDALDTCLDDSNLLIPIMGEFTLMNMIIKHHSGICHTGKIPR